VLSVAARSLERDSKGRILAEDLKLTPCDCGATPDWEVSATRANIEPGERALLTMPVIRVRGMPVMVLPALYIPLSSRRSGLLFPRPSYSRQSGFGVEAPLFITLGESYDVTLTPGFRFGQAEREPPLGQPAARAGPRGPRLSGELRYTPSTGTSGRLFLGGLNDLHRDIEAGPDGVPSFRDRPRGLRGELSWRHATESSSGLRAVADVSLVSDGFYLSDAAVDVLRDAPPYLRSQGHLAYRGADLVGLVSSKWYQDLAASASPSRALLGAEAPATTQRLPALMVLVPRARRVGPLRAGIDVVAVRYQPVAPFGRLGGKGADPPLTRLNVHPTVELPIGNEGPVLGGLLAGARGDVDSGPPHGSGRARANAYAGAYASTELSRVFGDGEGAVRHAVSPRFELRLAPRALGEPMGPLLDELARPAPEEGMVQGVVSLSNRFAKKSSGAAVEWARLDLSQGVDLLGRTLLDASARVSVSHGPFALGAEGRYDVGRGRAAYAAATAAIDDGRGDGLSASYERLLASGTGRMRAGVDALLGPVAPEEPGGLSDQLYVSANAAPLRGLSLRYAATVHPRAQKLLQHAAGVGFETSCECWRVDLALSQIPGSMPTVGFVLDLKSFGSVGGGG
jgi:LPS-assembly protein